MILISGCLIGQDCAWDGKNRTHSLAQKLFKAGIAIPICPEQFGGLSTPRKPAERSGDKVFDIDGKDVTLEFVRGANEALKVAKMINARTAVLKARSPSCGFRKIYDGTFNHIQIDKDGISAELLKNSDLEIFSEEDLTEEIVDRLIQENTF